MKFTTSCIVTALLCAPAIVNAAPTGSGPTIKNAGQASIFVSQGGQLTDRDHPLPQIKSGNALQFGKGNSNGQCFHILSRLVPA